MTHLSIKTLRHYHDVGLLTPAEIDPSSGYRRYDAAQVPTAQVIRRFRELGMPVDEVISVLRAPSVESRNAALIAHLKRMEDQLAQTQATVASLRNLLERPAEPLSVEYRGVTGTRALAIREHVDAADFQDWWIATFTELRGALSVSGATRSGPDSSLYFNEFFELDGGDVIAFIPIAQDAARVRGRVELADIPAAELAVAVHRGSLEDLDRTYGALGAHVNERALSVQGPIRELYTASPLDVADESGYRIEVCWPIFRTRPAE
jgi:DNA-binding transcriptional MerR regulator/effector-binding domain-containing protein